MKFNLTIDTKTVEKTYQHVIKETAENVTIKGFRKGKAPLDLVEKSVDQEKIYEHVINDVIPPAYAKYIQENKLQPITQPKIKVKDLAPDKDWTFEVEIAEKPEVKLGDYEKAVKDVVAKSSIWTPDKGDSAKEDPSKAASEKLNKILETLLKTVKVEVPTLLIEEDVNRSLSQLINQVSQLGLTVEKYLTSIGKTSEQLKADYAAASENNWKLEFIFEAIAKEKKLEATDKEIDQALTEIKNEADRKRVKQNPETMATVRYTVTRRKVIAYLQNL